MQDLNNSNISTGLIIDFSHANCEKKFERQIDVGSDVASQISTGETGIVGCMIESNLVEGRQDYSSNELVYGQSITGPCLGWNDTEALLQTLADAISTGREG